MDSWTHGSLKEGGAKRNHRDARYSILFTLFRLLATTIDWIRRHPLRVLAGILLAAPPSSGRRLRHLHAAWVHAAHPGQVDYIRKWIEAGAPRIGDVADAALLSSTVPQRGTAFVKFAAPPAGQGFQIHVDPFGVTSNFERELFVYRKLGNPAAIYVNRIQTLMRPLSHHFVLYASDPSTAPGFPFCIPPANVVRDIRNPDGSMNLTNMLPMACHVFIGGSMAQASDYAFPDGVALQMPALMAIDMNVHYGKRRTAIGSIRSK
jgi:hypothetical protein